MHFPLPLASPLPPLPPPSSTRKPVSCAVYLPPQDAAKAECQKCMQYGHNPRLKPKHVNADDAPEIPLITDGDWYRDRRLAEQIKQEEAALYKNTKKVVKKRDPSLPGGEVAAATASAASATGSSGVAPLGGSVALHSGSRVAEEQLLLAVKSEPVDPEVLEQQKQKQRSKLCCSPHQVGGTPRGEEFGRRDDEGEAAAARVFARESR
ncbi:zinc knuckle domain-containing protein [Cyclospora cayetanensis]|uniref:Zinc knuckle domain-containing protein n=1 Tax=Cyclospora cayetanensis TaxID=88456 RepID=A0A1D3CRU9_9EIME|nr:zinc knuckle domain-containing protein [Cyclospora cayetanensis]